MAETNKYRRRSSTPENDPCRVSIRLSDYDYAQAGAYFVTICAQERRSLFGAVEDGTMRLNAAGKMAVKAWEDLPGRFPNLELDYFVMMPNHFHGILVLQDDEGKPDTGLSDRVSQGISKNSLARIIQAYKSITTNEYITGVKKLGWAPFVGRIWQRNYWEHVVRNEKDLNSIREYIVNNPMKWELDEENPEKGKHPFSL